MASPGTLRHTLAVLALGVVLAAAGCSTSHSGSGAGEDGGSGEDGDSGSRDGGSGTTDAGDRDAGVVCGAIDPGICVGGPCCDEEVFAEVDFDTCTSHCPAGFDWPSECELDPAAFCGPRFDACERNDDCELANDGCCWPCGEPTLADYDAINGDYREEHHASVCDDPTPACPRCATMPNPALGATCSSGTCQGFDVRAMDLSACSVDTDCRLRVTQCCECGGDTTPYSLIAIRVDADAEYQGLVCDATDCPECAPVYPTDRAEAYCAEDGHCDVRILAP